MPSLNARPAEQLDEWLAEIKERLYREVLEATRNHPHYKVPISGPNRGRGVAAGFWFNIGGASSCSVSSWLRSQVHWH